MIRTIKEAKTTEKERVKKDLDKMNDDLNDVVKKIKQYASGCEFDKETKEEWDESYANFINGKAGLFPLIKRYYKYKD